MSALQQPSRREAEREPASASERRLPTFIGPKTTASIIHRERWQRDALIFLSLDPAVDVIAPAGVGEKPSGVMFSLKVRHRSQGWLRIDFVANENLRKRYAPGLGALAVSREAIMSCAGLEARRAVWSARDTQVSANERFALVQALEEAKEDLTLDTLIRRVQGKVKQGIKAICALACEGLLVIDLAQGLVPEAPVRKRDPPRDTAPVPVSASASPGEAASPSPMTDHDTDSDAASSTSR
jgi:hypothetical protein